MPAKPQRYLINIEVESRCASLAEISAVMGMQPGSRSHERGEKSRFGRRRFATTLWAFDVRKWSSLNRGLSSVATDAMTRRLRAVKRRYRDVTPILNVGVLYYTEHVAYAAVLFPPKILAWCSASGAAIHLAAYPCSD